MTENSNHPDTLANDLMVRQLGRKDYEPVWRAMKEFTNNRNSQTTDELWVVEHNPIFTQGQAGKPEHILFPGKYTCYSDRPRRPSDLSWSWSTGVFTV